MSYKRILFTILLSASGFLITKQANSMVVETYAVSDYNDEEYEDEEYEDEEYEDEEYEDEEYEDKEYEDKEYEDERIIKDNSPEQEKMLVAHFKFEDNLKDSSDNKNNGNLAYGDITFDKGRNGKAARFDGESYIEVEDNDSLNLDEAFTISVWLNKFEDEEYRYSPILSKGTGSQSVDLPYILYHDGAIAYPFLDLHNYNEWDSLSIEDSGEYMYDRWQLVTVTFDSAIERVDFYIDGTFIGYESWVYGELYNTDQNLYIGYGKLDGVYEFYMGLMDELRIYNYALTDKEIKALYNETIPEQKVYSSILITPSKMAIIKAESTLNINVTGVLKDGKKENISKLVKYQSSDIKTATVSNEGKVKALKKGKATVTVSYGKLKKVLNITVK